MKDVLLLIEVFKITLDHTILIVGGRRKNESKIFVKNLKDDLVFL